MINELATKFQERFGANFKLLGVIQINEYPFCSMQVLNESHSKFKRTKEGKKFKNVKTIIQFNYSTEDPLKDLEFIDKFTSYLQSDFKLDFHPKIEMVNYSDSRDLTEIVSGTTIYAKSIDVTFNRFVSYEPEIIEITGIKGDLESAETIELIEIDKEE